MNCVEIDTYQGLRPFLSRKYVIILIYTPLVSPINNNRNICMKKQVTIRVYPDGRIESETHGINGKDCLKYIKEIEQLTGAKTYSSQFTEE